MLKQHASPAIGQTNPARPALVLSTLANRRATNPSDFSSRRIARQAALILMVIIAAVIALVEVAWHLEIFLKLLPA